MSQRWTSLGIVSLLATLTLAQLDAHSAADPSQPQAGADAQADPHRSAEAAARAAIALAKRDEKSGRTRDAVVRYLIAATLAPDLDQPHDALNRLADKPFALRGAGEKAPALDRIKLADRIREQRVARLALEQSVDRLDDSVNSLRRRLDTLDRELDDKGRVERLVDRLDRQRSELERDVMSLRREVGRLRREVAQLRREVR